MGREFGSTSPAVSRCHRGPCPGLANQDHGRGDSESQLGPSGGGCDRESAMVGDLMDGRDIWVESSDPHPLLSHVVTVGHVLARQDRGRGDSESQLGPGGDRERAMVGDLTDGHDVNMGKGFGPTSCCLTLSPWAMPWPGQPGPWSRSQRESSGGILGTGFQSVEIPRFYGGRRQK